MRGAAESGHGQEEEGQLQQKRRENGRRPGTGEETEEVPVEEKGDAPGNATHGTPGVGKDLLGRVGKCNCNLLHYLTKYHNLVH